MVHLVPFTMNDPKEQIPADPITVSVTIARLSRLAETMITEHEQGNDDEIQDLPLPNVGPETLGRIFTYLKEWIESAN
jgi:hypothetical protein